MRISVNAIKQILFDKGRLDEVKVVERFQDIEGRPFQELYGAVAVLSSVFYNENAIKTTATAKHPNKDRLSLLVIRGADLMTLTDELYDQAANEA